MGTSAQCCDATVIPPGQFQFPALTDDRQVKFFFKQYPNIEEILIDLKYDKDIKKIKCQQIIHDNEGTYLGQLQQTMKNGQGIMLYKEGTLYFGQWKNDMKSGQGVIIYKDGDYYIGNWQKNQPNGKGQYVTKGNKYNGFWEQGKRQGKGTQTYEDGSFYTGQFRAGEKWGNGKIVYRDGTFYQGNFIKNRIQGFGTYTGHKHKYQGQWVDGKMSGTGKSQWYNDKDQVVSAYIGQYLNGLKHGYGEYKWGKGKTYKGKWQQGQIKNNGVLVDIQNSIK